jgi:ubiquitin carboxyl-terminal hydrolase 25
VPLVYSGYSNVAAVLPAESCRHTWCAKVNQNVSSALNVTHDRESSYTFCGVCRNCRIHLEVEIGYTLKTESKPCPKANYPLHHLSHSPPREGTRNDPVAGANAESHTMELAFECSAPGCSAVVRVRYMPPVLSDEHIRLLIDGTLLSRRTREVIDSEPSRYEGHKSPSPGDVLADLRSYLQNSLDHEAPRPIKVDNKRFALRFGTGGQPCSDVLTFLGFQYEVRFSSLLTYHGLPDLSHSPQTTGYPRRANTTTQYLSQSPQTSSSTTSFGR